MKLVFLGTGAFGLPTLKAIQAHPQFELCGIVTGPDKPQGRGRKIAPTPIAEWAAAQSFQPVWKPARLNDPAFAAQLRDVAAGVFVVVAYRILPETVFTLADYAFNLHASLLPAYRGAAPIQRAIMAGEISTGVTTFLLQKTVDTGGILLQKETAIGPNENAGELAERLSILGAGVVMETLLRLSQGDFRPQTQDNSRASAAPKITSADRILNFEESGTTSVNRVRGLAPTPGAVALFRQKLVKILAMSDTGALTESAAGEVIEANPKSKLVVAGGGCALEVKLIQPEGKAPQTGAEFVRGYRVAEGERFETVG
ncbi:MAG: methionyl-tRNA formyltransferase [candidate division Zixibacteria bacterium]|nr:methionyl-tRNA formyltransferase [candidate division Zixibacteria bacterium]